MTHDLRKPFAPQAAPSTRDTPASTCALSTATRKGSVLGLLRVELALHLGNGLGMLVHQLVVLRLPIPEQDDPHRSRTRATMDQGRQCAWATARATSDTNTHKISTAMVALAALDEGTPGRAQPKP